MSLVVNALQPLMVRGLTTVEGRPSGLTLADLLGKQNTSGYDLSFDEHAELIIADFRGAKIVVDSLASDSARLAGAAFESIAHVADLMQEKGQLAWALIRIYYAAFYAGHAMIRMLGESCSYFDRTHILRISALADAVGNRPRFKLDAGVYHCLLSPDGAVISCRNVRGGSGGAHESFWNIFGTRLSAVSEAVLRGALNAHEGHLVFARIDALVRSIRRHGVPFHSWLSMMRNEVQYRHKFGVWFPCKIKRHDRERLGRLANQWTRDPMAVDIGAVHFGSLGEFVVTCAFIVALCRALWMRVAERSTRTVRSIATLGPIACLKQARCL